MGSSMSLLMTHDVVFPGHCTIADLVVSTDMIISCLLSGLESVVSDLVTSAEKQNLCVHKMIQRQI